MKFESPFLGRKLKFSCFYLKMCDRLGERRKPELFMSFPTRTRIEINILIYGLSCSSGRNKKSSSKEQQRQSQMQDRWKQQKTETTKHNRNCSPFHCLRLTTNSSFRVSSCGGWRSRRHRRARFFVSRFLLISFANRPNWGSNCARPPGPDPCARWLTIVQFWGKNFGMMMCRICCSAQFHSPMTQRRCSRRNFHKNEERKHK